jgi:hypothetical protein
MGDEVDELRTLTIAKRWRCAAIVDEGEALGLVTCRALVMATRRTTWQAHAGRQASTRRAAGRRGGVVIVWQGNSRGEARAVWAIWSARSGRHGMAQCPRPCGRRS